MARSLRKPNAVDNFKKKKPVPDSELEKPEDSVRAEDVDIKDPNYDLKHNSILKKDDNGTRGARHVITCACCGKPKYEEYFYKNESSFLFTGIWNCIPFCKACLDSLYRRYSMDNEQMASAAAVVAAMDLPFIDASARTQFEDGIFKVGNYARLRNFPAMRGKTFINSIISGEFFDVKDKIKIDIERSWDIQDRRNKKFVISKYGYDPYEAFGYEDTDYRAAFNITAKYLEDESILQDAHKMQSLVTMVATILQSNKVETLLTYQYRNIKPDTNEIRTLTATKKDLQATISKLAEDNNISSKYQKENKSAQNHLTSKMKEMATAEYWEAKPNMFDVRTSAAMRQMMDISHQSILSQLELADSDYANMVKEQREMIKNLQDKCDRLEEENRNLTNRYIAATLDDKKKKE